MPSSPALSLTPQQHAVVQHQSGPALVFAVAGAGKTTAMVHRIERLVREESIQPRQLLATTFGKANVADLKTALSRWPHCTGVDCRTLHSLGRLLIKKAQRLGHLRHLKLGDGDQDGVEQRLLNATLAAARSQAVDYLPELDGLDRQDFLDYVGACKGNLAYADLSAVDLPQPYDQLAQQAAAPSPELSWYLDLYQLLELVRQEAGVVTFDDMLLTGWEVLVRWPEVTEAVQAHYVHVLVDEYQDINRAQSQILDLITAGQRNYMAIGDDDQCIYEWRGADPAYILNFAGRYGAAVYKIENNFRCPAAPLVLANQVIAHNRHRAPKQMALTRGFAGQTAVTISRDLTEMSSKLAAQIQQLLQEEPHGANEIAVLVRLNAQTPPIEQALIAADIPYRVGTPFYERTEIQILIHYGRLAWYETQFAGAVPALSGKSLAGLIASWQAVCNRPKRYIANEVRRHIEGQLRQQNQPVSTLLETLSQRVAEPWLQDNLIELAEVLRWLAANLQAPARQVLDQLVERLDYLEFLRESSGFAETGEGRAASVEAFVAFAGQDLSFLSFMAQIREMASQRTGQSEKGRPAVTLSTIHRAKGLEWEHVFIPQVNQATLPYLGRTVPNIEEERRLFYVALTRTRRNLYLHALETPPLSLFLQQVRYEQTLSEIARLAAVCQRTPDSWQAQDVAALLLLSERYGFTSYFQQWWTAAAEEQTVAAARIHTFWQALQARSGNKAAVIQARHVSPWLGEGLPDPPAGAASDFPGLHEWLTELGKEQGKGRPARDKRPSGTKRSATKSSIQPPVEPEEIQPGMWVLCDAGWGQLEAIGDADKRPLATVGRQQTDIYLSVVLRPQADRLRLEIDVSARRLTFTTDQPLYACSKCAAFVTTERALILRDHNREMHDDVSPGLRRLQGHSLPLTHLRFSRQPLAKP